MRRLNYEKNKLLSIIASATLISSILASSIYAYALDDSRMPSSITVDGRVFIMDVTAGGGSGTATPDIDMDRSVSASYYVTGSDVRLYIDPSHGHGGDNFASGYVSTSAPRFTARAEVWSNGRLNTTGPNCINRGGTANASSYLACGIISNATPRIFYSW